jgi:hypothetical protein
MTRRFRIGLVAISMVAAACVGTPPSTPGAALSAATPIDTASPSPTPTAKPTATPSPAEIVGEWVGVHDCARIMTLLEKAGLTEFLDDAVGSLIPTSMTSAELAGSKDPCKGAVQQHHSHFFTASGAFGSKDFDGSQVDDGTYTLEGADVIVINDQHFHYRINGDQLSLDPEPVDISACQTRECRFTATWVLMVAMPGMPWTRGEITST